MLVMFAPRTQKPKKGSELGRLIKEDKEPKEQPAAQPAEETKEVKE